MFPDNPNENKENNNKKTINLMLKKNGDLEIINHLKIDTIVHLIMGC